MNKKYLNFLLIFMCIVIIILCFYQNDNIAPSILESATIFITKVFPFLFIMMILNQLLIALNLPYYLYKVTRNPYIYIFITSALSGSPVNAVILKKLLDKKMINTMQASKILSFTTLNNPLFLYNYFKLIFNNHIVILKIFLIIYLCNILFLIMMIIKHPHQINLSLSSTTDIKKELTSSITSTINNLLNIFAIITFFKLICDLLIPSNTILTIFFKGIVEITQGLNLLASINIPLKIKELLTIVILSFSGFSIHIQISNILSGYNINYKYFYISRFILIFLGTILVFST